MPSLTTPRLLLRQWHRSDAEAFVEMSADPAVMAYIGNGSTKNRNQALASFEMLSAGWRDSPHGLFAVELLEDQSFIGFCGLSEPAFLPEILPSVELGWRLRRSAWGKGLATEAAGAVADWAFDALSIQRLVSVIHVDNAPSIALAKRLSMSQERRTVVPTSSVWVDVYELKAETWATSHDD